MEAIFSKKDAFTTLSTYHAKLPLENNLLEEILRLDLEHFDDFCYKVEGQELNTVKPFQMNSQNLNKNADSDFQNSEYH